MIKQLSDPGLGEKFYQNKSNKKIIMYTIANKIEQNGDKYQSPKFVGAI